jgi:hypothetical protein
MDWQRNEGRKPSFECLGLGASKPSGSYQTWRKVYDDADTIRARHGCTGASVLRSPKAHDLVFITHHFPTVEQAEAFAADPKLHSAMAQAGVIGDPGIEIFEDIP